MHREGTKNAKILYISFVLRALRVFAVYKRMYDGMAGARRAGRQNRLTCAMM
jgi:hypothetical protein